MITDFVSNSCCFEFGYSLSIMLLCPYILKKQGINIPVYSNIPFPKLMEKSISDSFFLSRKGSPKGGIRKENLSRFLKEKKIEKHCTPIPVDIDFSEEIEKNYVCLIPLHKYKDTKGRKLKHVLLEEHWVEIANFIRSKGYKVIGFGNCEGTTENVLDKISDKYFMLRDNSSMTKYKCPFPNDFFIKQLFYMKYAKLTFALGGASHISFAFDVPGFSICETFYQILNPYFFSVAKNRSTPFYFIENWYVEATKRGKINGFDINYKKWLLNLILSNLDNIL